MKNKPKWYQWDELMSREFVAKLKDALLAGCTCPVIDNHYGHGYSKGQRVTVPSLYKHDPEARQ